MRIRDPLHEMSQPPVPRRARLLAPALAAAAALALAAHVLHVTAGFGGPQTDGLFSNWVYNGVIVAGALLCLLRAWSVREQRGAWLAFGIGILSWSLGEIYYSL